MAECEGVVALEAKAGASRSVLYTVRGVRAARGATYGFPPRTDACFEGVRCERQQARGGGPRWLNTFVFLAQVTTSRRAIGPAIASACCMCCGNRACIPISHCIDSARHPNTQPQPSHHGSLTHARAQACACASHTTLPASRPRPHASRHLTQLQWLASAASRSLRNESMRRRPVVQYLAAPRHHHQRPCHLAKANVCQLPAREPPAHPLHRAASAEPRSLRNERIRARPRAHCTATPPPPADRPRHEPCEAAGRRHVHSHLTRAAAYATHERAMPCACQVHRTHLHGGGTSGARAQRFQTDCPKWLSLGALDDRWGGFLGYPPRRIKTCVVA